MKKSACRIIALFMALMMFFCSVPVDAIAETLLAIDDQSIVTENTQEEGNSQPEETNVPLVTDVSEHKKVNISLVKKEHAL